MSTKGTTFHKSKMSEWYHPDAPIRYEQGRRCIRGVECVQYAYGARWGDCQPAKVRSTVPEHGMHPETGELIVLCDRCEAERLKSGKSVRKFLGLSELAARGKNFHGTAYPLPNLEKARNAADVTQKTLAKGVGMWATTIAKVEKGANASESTAQRFASFLGVSLGYLKGEE